MSLDGDTHGLIDTLMVDMGRDTVLELKHQSSLTAEDIDLK